MSLLSYELLAHDTIRRQLDEIDRDRLAAQLPAGPAALPRLARAGRASVARALRAAAMHLDSSAVRLDSSAGAVPDRRLLIAGPR